MPRISITAVDGFSAADVMHPTTSTLAADASVAELRDYFAVSTSRRLAILVDGERYVGAIEVESPALAAAAPTGPARALAAHEPTVAPDAPAAEARDRALATTARRVPVVDDGRLVGVVAIDALRVAFCGTERAAPPT